MICVKNAVYIRKEIQPLYMTSWGYYLEIQGLMYS